MSLKRSIVHALIASYARPSGLFPEGLSLSIDLIEVESIRVNFRPTVALGQKRDNLARSRVVSGGPPK